MAGRRKGTKNFQARRLTIERLQYLMNSAGKIIQDAELETLESIAPEIIDAVASDAEFNNYTGNLEDAYVATVYRRRKPVVEFWHNATAKSPVEEGRWAGERTAKLALKRHTIRLTSEEVERKSKGMVHYMTDRYRYLKRWEKEEGYRRGYKASISSVGGLTGNWRAQNYITIENVAPYAEAVQQGKGRNHYNVLRSAFIRKQRGRATSLLHAIVEKDLRTAGLIK